MDEAVVILLIETTDKCNFCKRGERRRNTGSRKHTHTHAGVSYNSIKEVRVRTLREDSSR